MALEYVHDVDGNVLEPGVALLLETHSRLGLRSRWVHMIELLPRGGVDQLTLGDLELVIRLAQHERVLLYSGLGVRLMIDGTGVVPGFNFTYGFDVFPMRPLVISATVDLGNLGKTFFASGRLQLGLVFGRVEPYLGYEVMRAGPVYHGPVAGIRFWF